MHKKINSNFTNKVTNVWYNDSFKCSSTKFLNSFFIKFNFFNYMFFKRLLAYNLGAYIFSTHKK